MLVHDYILLMGFAKAFGYGDFPQLTKGISKSAGIFWLLSAFLFFATVLMLLLRREAWPLLAILAATISQLLIVMVWKDAKFGAIANIIIL